MESLPSINSSVPAAYMLACLSAKWNEKLCCLYTKTLLPAISSPSIRSLPYLGRQLHHTASLLWTRAPSLFHSLLVAIIFYDTRLNLSYEVFARLLHRRCWKNISYELAGWLFFRDDEISTRREISFFASFKNKRVRSLEHTEKAAPRARRLVNGTERGKIFCLKKNIFMCASRRVTPSFLPSTFHHGESSSGECDCEDLSRSQLDDCADAKRFLT